MSKPVRDITVTVSEPYHVEGFHGSRYGLSSWSRRDYTCTLGGRQVKQTNKGEITSLIRQFAYREGFRANITFTSEAEPFQPRDGGPIVPTCTEPDCHGMHGDDYHQRGTS